MAIMIEVDDTQIELSDDPVKRIGELSKMFISLILDVCDETDTNFCNLAADFSRQLVGTMILNGHGKCAANLRKEMNEAIAFLMEKAEGETAH